MKKIIKVLHVGEYVQGGVATYVRTIINHNNPYINDYIVLSNYKSEHSWNLPRERIIYYDYHRSLFSIPKAIYNIKKAIEKINPDVIYCHSTWAGFFVRVPMLLKKPKCNVLYNAHGWAFLQNIAEWKRKIYASIEKILSFRTNQIINVSQNEYDMAVKYGLDAGKLCVIYSGISADRKSGHYNVDLPKDKINILFVGRFDLQKGIDYLLDEFVKCNRNDLFLTVIGDNVINKNDYKKKYKKENIKFLGWVKHDEIADYYEAVDVVVMPSRWEAFGLVAIEAMKYSTPVIVSNRGALREIIAHGKTGYVFPFDKGALTKVLQMLSKEELLKLGKNAEKEFLKKYQESCMLKSTVFLYEKYGNDTVGI